MKEDAEKKPVEIGSRRQQKPPSLVPIQYFLNHRITRYEACYCGGLVPKKSYVNK